MRLRVSGDLGDLASCRRAFTEAPASGEQAVIQPSSSWTGMIILMLVCEGADSGWASARAQLGAEGAGLTIVVRSESSFLAE